MKKIITTMAVAALLSSTTVFSAQQSSVVQADIDAFQGHFKKKFSHLSLNDFSKGPYAMSEDKMGQFEAVMEMPPFEDYIEKGEKLWKTAFKNGKTLAAEIALLHAAESSTPETLPEGEFFPLCAWSAATKSTWTDKANAVNVINNSFLMLFSFIVYIRYQKSPCHYSSQYGNILDYHILSYVF
jgi:hypothetical protein